MEGFPVEVSLGRVNHVDTLLVKGFHPVGIYDKSEKNDSNDNHGNNETIGFGNVNARPVGNHFLFAIK